MEPCGSGSGQVLGNPHGVKVVPKFLDSSLERTMLLATLDGINAICLLAEAAKSGFLSVSKSARSGSKFFISRVKQAGGFKYPSPEKRKKENATDLVHHFRRNGPTLQKLLRERTHVRSEDPSERCCTDLHSRAF